MGRAYLAGLDEAARSALLGRLAQAEPKGWPALRLGIDRALEGYAARGFVLSINEWMPEINAVGRSEEHTSELQSLMRISYAVFCLKKKNNNKKLIKQHNAVLSNIHTYQSKVRTSRNRRANMPVIY